VSKPSLGLLWDFEVVVQTPASFFFMGEWAVVAGRPAMMMPIPLYLKLGASRTNGPFRFKEFMFLDSQANKEVPLNPLDDPTKARLGREIQEFLGLTKDQGLVLRTESTIPPKHGLGSSGAFCAALSLASCMIYRNLRSEDVNKWGAMSLKDLLSNKDFVLVFDLARRLEAVVQSGSSGAGPFAALVGAPDSLPITYWQIPGSQPFSYGAFRLSELLDSFNSNRVAEVLWDEAEFALVYSGVPRQESDLEVENSIEKLIRRIHSFADGLGSSLARLPESLPPDGRKVPNSFGELISGREIGQKSVESDLWNSFDLLYLGFLKNLIDGDFDDMTAILDIIESFLFWMRFSTPTIEKVAGHFRRLKIACKITGAGGGGDVLVFSGRNGLKPNLDSILEQISREWQVYTPMPIHFKSWEPSQRRQKVSGATVLSVREHDTRADEALNELAQKMQQSLKMTPEGVTSCLNMLRQILDTTFEGLQIGERSVAFASSDTISPAVFGLIDTSPIQPNEEQMFSALTPRRVFSGNLLVDGRGSVRAVYSYKEGFGGVPTQNFCARRDQKFSALSSAGELLVFQLKKGRTPNETSFIRVFDGGKPSFKYSIPPDSWSKLELTKISEVIQKLERDGFERETLVSVFQLAIESSASTQAGEVGGGFFIVCNYAGREKVFGVGNKLSGNVKDLMRNEAVLSDLVARGAEKAILIEKDGTLNMSDVQVPVNLEDIEYVKKKHPWLNDREVGTKHTTAAALSHSQPGTLCLVVSHNGGKMTAFYKDEVLLDRTQY
jgi:mevalonate kinase